MTLENLDNLDNLVKVKKLKVEAPDQQEFEGMLNSAKRRLQDSQLEGLSAMRWHGYRSENRYLVFQCLQHTVGLENAKWRVLDKCHHQRNLAEYEGHLEITPQLLKELLSLTAELAVLVEAMGPVKSS